MTPSFLPAKHKAATIQMMTFVTTSAASRRTERPKRVRDRFDRVDHLRRCRAMSLWMVMVAKSLLEVVSTFFLFFFSVERERLPI
jgi:hypothetical protein